MLHLLLYTCNAVATKDTRCQVERESAGRPRVIVARTILSAGIYHWRGIVNLFVMQIIRARTCNGNFMLIFERYRNYHCRLFRFAMIGRDVCSSTGHVIQETPWHKVLYALYQLSLLCFNLLMRSLSHFISLSA